MGSVIGERQCIAVVEQQVRTRPAHVFAPQRAGELAHLAVAPEALNSDLDRLSHREERVVGDEPLAPDEHAQPRSAALLSGTVAKAGCHGLCHVLDAQHGRHGAAAHKGRLWTEPQPAPGLTLRPAHELVDEDHPSRVRDEAGDRRKFGHSPGPNTAVQKPPPCPPSRRTAP